MEELLKVIICGGALFLLLLGFADMVLLAVGAVLFGPEEKKDAGELTILLQNPDRAEMQLRSFLWKQRCRPSSGRVLVLAKDEESYIIAGKILRKYPNIGLLYRSDLHYNIK